MFLNPLNPFNPTILNKNIKKIRNDYLHAAPFEMFSARSSHLPFKMHWAGFRAFKSPLYYQSRANRNDKKYKYT